MYGFTGTLIYLTRYCMLSYLNLTDLSLSLY